MSAAFVPDVALERCYGRRMAWVALVWPGGGRRRGDGVAVCRWVAGRRRAADRTPGSCARDHLRSCRRLRGRQVRIFPGIAVPRGITAGPDGALWFTNPATTRSGGSPPPGWSPTTPAPASTSPTGSRPGPTGRCGSPTTATTRSGGSPPPGWSPTTPAPASTSRRDHGRARTGPCGSPTPATTRSGGSPPPGWSPTTPAPASTSPTGSRPGRTGRCGSPTTTATRSGGSPPPGVVTNYTGTGIDRPGRDHGRAGRGAVVHQPRQQTRSGGSPPTGVVTNYTGTGIDDPDGITAGPDGALWFTNDGNNSIGRITTAGMVTNYTGTGIDGPTGSPPGRTARCGSPTTASNSIGRITTTGVVTNYTGTGIDEPGRDHRRARRGAVVHQLRQQLDRADHHHRGGHQLHRPRHRRARTGSPPGPTGRCGSPTPATTRSGGSPPPGWSPTTPAPASTSPEGITAGPDGALWFTNDGNNSIGRITTAGVVTNYTGTGIDEPERDHRRARRRAVVHQLRQQLDRADHHRRSGHQLHRHRHRRARTGSPPGPTAPCGSPTPATTRSGGSPPPASVTNYTGTGIDEPDGDHGRPRRRPVVHQLPATTSIGRITTAGTVTNYTDTGIDDPDGITAGPDGALWFTNYGNNSIGRITTTVPRRPEASPPPTFPASALAAR